MVRVADLLARVSNFLRSRPRRAPKAGQDADLPIVGPEISMVGVKEASVFLGFRDPRDILRARIDSKVSGAETDAVNAARGSVIKSGQGAANVAKKAAGGGAKVAASPPKKKKKMGFWPFGEKKEEGATPTCGGCGKEVDPTWQACPYCRGPLGQAAPPAAPAPFRGSMIPPVLVGGPPNMPTMAGDKTLAIDISALAGPKKQVVGWLVVMSGNQKGIDFRLFDGVNNIGAAADNDVVITDEYLSSKHCMIRYEDGRYEFKDNDSTNGSFLNERRTSKDELVDNDTIRLGRTEMRFKALY